MSGLEILIKAHFKMTEDLMPVEYVKKDYSHDFTAVKTTTSYHIINCFRNMFEKELMLAKFNDQIKS